MEKRVSIGYKYYLLYFFIIYTIIYITYLYKYCTIFIFINSLIEL